MTFTARHPGRCGSCDEPIQPGDEIGYAADGEIAHADCYETREEPRPSIPEGPFDSPYLAELRTRAICPFCHLTRPCEHDEDNR